MVDDIAQYLADGGLGTVATNIFSTFHPSSPDNCITVIDTGGPEPPGDLPAMRTPTFQVIVRNADFDDGKVVFDAVRSRLQSVKNTTIGNTYFYFILLVSEGGHIGNDGVGRDTVGRDEWSLNFRCQTR